MHGRTWRSIALVGALLVALLVAGCGGPSAEEVGNAVEKAYEEQTGRTDVKSRGYDPIDNDASESHQIMTQMLLSGAGMNSDLDSYESIQLVSMVKDDGTEFKAVRIDGKVVLPQNLDQ